MIAKVALIGLREALAEVSVEESNLCEFGLESRVTAVVGPVGVQHPDFGHGRISLLARKVAANLQEVLIGHRETEGGIKFAELIFRHVNEALNGLHIFRRGEVLAQGCGLLFRALSGVHGINAEILDGREFPLAELAREHIGRRGANEHLRVLVNQTDALLRGVRALVELSRQKLGRKYRVAVLAGKCLLIQQIERRLGKNGAARLFVGAVLDILDIVAHQNAHALNAGNTEIGLNVLKKLSGAHCIFRFLLYIDPSNAHSLSFRLSPDSLECLHTHRKKTLYLIERDAETNGKILRTRLPAELRCEFARNVAHRIQTLRKRMLFRIALTFLLYGFLQRGMHVPLYGITKYSAFQRFFIAEGCGQREIRDTDQLSDIHSAEIGANFRERCLEIRFGETFSGPTVLSVDPQLFE